MEPSIFDYLSICPEHQCSGTMSLSVFTNRPELGRETQAAVGHQPMHHPKVRNDVRVHGASSITAF